jgi:predicted membrane protein
VVQSYCFVVILQNFEKTKTYLILLLLSSIIGLFGYSNLNRQSLKMINGNAAEWTFFPLLFMIYYWLLRKIFLIIFKEEPLMTGYMQSSWEQGEIENCILRCFLQF